MTTPTVPVTVTLTAQDGTPYAGVTVRAQMDGNEVYQGIVAARQASVVTDANGVAVLNLFPNAPAPTGLGTQGTTYRIWASIPNGHNVTYHARVPSTPCRLENILVLEDVGPLSAAELAVFQAQASVSTSAESAAAAASSANAAYTSASAAAGSASNASSSASTAALSASSAQTIANNFGNLSAATSAASESANLAQAWATQTSSEVVAGQGYGAKKYAQDAQAAAAGITGFVRRYYPSQGVTVYVDSVGGSDTNSGLTNALPVKTLAKALTLVTGNFAPALMLKRGSVFREQFQVPDYAFVAAYGDGAAPIISGADLLVNANFTLAAGKTKTYQYSLPSIPSTTNPYVGVTNSDVLMVWENDVRFGYTFTDATLAYTRPASIADVEATPGSFWWDSANKLLYVHPFGDLNPTTNNKTYEVSVRTLAVHGGDGFFVEGIVAEKAGAKTTAGQQGYAILGYRSGTYKNCTGRYAWNHAVGVANSENCGDLLFDTCTAQDCERQFVNAPTLFIAYRAGTYPSRVIFKDCVAIQGSVWGGNPAFSESGYYAHGSSIVVEYRGLNYAYNTRYGVQFLIDGGATNAQTILNGAFAVQGCITGVSVNSSAQQDLTIVLFAKNCTAIAGVNKSCTLRVKALDCPQGISATGGTGGSPVRVLLEDSMLMNTTAPANQLSSSGVTGNANNTFNIQRTLFHNIGSAITGASDNPLTGADYNQYSGVIRPANGVSFAPGFFTDLPSWKTASGYDTNSTATAETLTFQMKRFPSPDAKPSVEWNA